METNPPVLVSSDLEAEFLEYLQMSYQTPPTPADSNPQQFQQLRDTWYAGAAMFYAAICMNPSSHEQTQKTLQHLQDQLVAYGKNKLAEAERRINGRCRS